MEHRKTPPVLRRTQPELIADDERSRRGRRVRFGYGLVSGGVLISAAATVVIWTDEAALQTGLAITVGLTAAVIGLWMLRAVE